jgi:poly-gamma-glutamate synthesis protein (capsule biosynthesis protein)
MGHRPRTTDGSKLRRLWSVVRCLVLTVLAVSLAGCGQHRTVTLALLGDILLGRGVTPTADSLAYLAPELSAADLALANLESPLGPGDEAPTHEYDLCAPAERASFLAGWGLDLLSLENNHADDCGPDGAGQTIAALSAAGLDGLTNEATIVEIDGLRLAFFAFDDVGSPLDGEAAAAAIRLAVDGGALAVVSIHWGVEYQAGPTPRQEALARDFVEAGAALVWGHHPHVLQRAEWLDAARSDNELRRRSALILYSLGNALFDQGGLADTRRSTLALVSLDRRGVEEVRFVPFVIDVRRGRLAAPDAASAGKIVEGLGIP